MLRIIGLALAFVPLASFHAGSGVHGQETSAAAAEQQASRALSDDAYEVVLRFYGYDDEMPLDARVLEREEDALQIREKVVFNGIRDSRVPAYLGLPKKGSGPHPVILLIDGIMGSKERWWEEGSWPRGKMATDALLSAGFAVFALDAQYHGERIAANDFENPGKMLFEHRWYNRTREMILQTTVEYRRAIDYLATRSELDTDRLGALGLSMGGIIVFGLNASDPRVEVSVAGVTPLNMWDPQELAVISPFLFARGVGKRPFLVLTGESDQWYSPAEVDELMDAIDGAPKELISYESGHRLPESYVADARDWFEAHL